MPKLKFQPSVTCLISTHDRVEDARINMEIIRAFWKTSGLFSDIHIVHAYNGQKHWYPQAHLENMLIRKKNPGHFQGAAELIDAGMARIIKQFPRTDYVVGLASDTWLTKPAFVYGLLAKMKRRRKTLAAAAWGLPRRNNPFDVGISSDFFIADFDWVRKYALFPLRYAEFEKRHGELLVYIKGSNVSLEKLFFARFQQACFRELPVNNKRRLFAEARLLRIS
ncbi:MAG: hypothetical protein Q8Q20_00690, partial [bacterium]|nr:hypothetical protein [bacterium]